MLCFLPREVALFLLLLLLVEGAQDADLVVLVLVEVEPVQMTVPTEDRPDPMSMHAPSAQFDSAMAEQESRLTYLSCRK